MSPSFAGDDDRSDRPVSKAIGDNIDVVINLP
jgi:hypothetical protein